LRGDNPPPGGGAATDSNTYSYLKAHVAGGAVAGLTDAQFRQLLTFYLGLTPDGLLNIERLQLAPVLVEDDDFYFHLLGAEVFAGSGLIADPTPPFLLYLSNFNQAQALGNPFTAGCVSRPLFQFLLAMRLRRKPGMRCSEVIFWLDLHSTR
jgi:hypothetical protein